MTKEIERNAASAVRNTIDIIDAWLDELPEEYDGDLLLAIDSLNEARVYIDRASKP